MSDTAVRRNRLKALDLSKVVIRHFKRSLLASSFPLLPDQKQSLLPSEEAMQTIKSKQFLLFP